MTQTKIWGCISPEVDSVLIIYNSLDQINPLNNNVPVWRDVRKYLNIISVWSPLALNPDLLAQIRSIDEVDFPGLSDLAEQILTFPIKMFSNIYKFVALQNLF